MAKADVVARWMKSVFDTVVKKVDLFGILSSRKILDK